MHRLIRSELTKAVTLPSIVFSVLVALVVPPALALVTGLKYRPTDPRWQSFPVESHGFEVAGFDQPLVILIAALVVGTEFTDHQLRTSFTATPRRGRLACAKLTVVVLLSSGVGAVATSAAVLVKHAALGPYGLSPAEFTLGMAWNLLGVVLNYAMIGLIAAAITVLARSFIVTLIILVPMVLGLTIGLFQVVPAFRYLPDLAGIQLLTGYPGMGLLDPVPGGLLMAAWTLAFTSVAAFAWLRRDANG